MYKLLYTQTYLTDERKLTKRNVQLELKLEKQLTKLAVNPFNNNFKTHKYFDPIFGKVFSSWITGDLRIGWEFHSERKDCISLLCFGGHSGRSKIYKFEIN